VTKDLLIAWILTIPVSALMSMAFYHIIRLFI
jgi:PiT family inorganic phosphate transporter